MVLSLGVAKSMLIIIAANVTTLETDKVDQKSVATMGALHSRTSELKKLAALREFGRESL